MPEEAKDVSGGDRLQRPPHRLDQRLSGARSGLPEQPLDLSEGLLYGVEIRGVRFRAATRVPLPSIH